MCQQAAWRVAALIIPISPGTGLWQRHPCRDDAATPPPHVSRPEAAAPTAEQARSVHAPTARRRLSPPRAIAAVPGSNEVASGCGRAKQHAQRGERCVLARPVPSHMSLRPKNTAWRRCAKMRRSTWLIEPAHTHGRPLLQPLPRAPGDGLRAHRPGVRPKRRLSSERSRGEADSISARRLAGTFARDD